MSEIVAELLHISLWQIFVQGSYYQLSFETWLTKENFKDNTDLK